MSRIMIAPPAEVLERIRQEAHSERRTPREQIEYVLIQKYGQAEKAPQGAGNVH